MWLPAHCRALALRVRHRRHSQPRTQPRGGANGSLGNGPVSSTGQTIGQFNYQNGSLGNQGYSATTQRIGQFDYTSGTIGNSTFSGNTQRIGNTQYLNGSATTPSYTYDYTYDPNDW